MDDGVDTFVYWMPCIAPDLILHGTYPMDVTRARMSEVTAAIFRDGKVIEHVALDARTPPLGEADFIWIEVLDPVDSDYSALQERFGLYSLAVEDSMSAAQLPKVDLYDDQIFVVLKAAHLEGDEIRYGADRRVRGQEPHHHGEA